MNKQSLHQNNKSCLALISSLKTKETLIHLVHKAANIFVFNLCANFPMPKNIHSERLQQYKKGYCLIIKLKQVSEATIFYISNMLMSRFVTDL